MKKSRFTDEQIIGALKRLDGGVPAKEVARDLGVTIGSNPAGQVSLSSAAGLI